jgi:hypothetical protein
MKMSLFSFKIQFIPPHLSIHKEKVGQRHDVEGKIYDQEYYRVPLALGGDLGKDLCYPNGKLFERIDDDNTKNVEQQMGEGHSDGHGIQGGKRSQHGRYRRPDICPEGVRKDFPHGEDTGTYEGNNKRCRYRAALDYGRSDKAEKQCCEIIPEQVLIQENFDLGEHE